MRLLQLTEGHKICKYADHVPILLASHTNSSVSPLQTVCYVKKLNSHLFLTMFLFVLWEFHIFIQHILTISIYHLLPPIPPLTYPLSPLAVVNNTSELQCVGICIVCFLFFFGLFILVA